MATDKNYLGIPFFVAKMKLEKKIDFYKTYYTDWDLIYIWACQWEMLKHDQGNSLWVYIRGIFKDYPEKRLQTRDFIRGGRVELLSICATITECENNMRILAYDANSLYPTVAIENEFMYESPMIAIGQQLNNIKLYDNKFYWLDEKKKKYRIKFGIIQCRVMLKRKNDCAGMPFLLCRINKRSMGIGCYKCARLKRKTFCKCSDTERSWIETYSLIEIETALKYGYSLMQIFECYFWINGVKLFADYMKLMASIRIKSSNVPKQWKSNLTGYACHINKILQIPEEFELKANDFKEDNSAKQYIKRVMNITLGKLIQRDKLDKTEYIFKKEKLDEIYQNPSNIIKNLQLIDDDILKVTYEKKRDLMKLDNKTQHYVGGYVTAFARCKMFEDIIKVVKSDPQAELLYTGIR